MSERKRTPHNVFTAFALRPRPGSGRGSVMRAALPCTCYVPRNLSVVDVPRNLSVVPRMRGPRPGRARPGGKGPHGWEFARLYSE